MRKLKKSVSVDKWERALAKFAHTYSNSDGWEIERFGYKRCKLSLKLRLLKNLLEAQFDGNIKFKAEINTKPADELRSEPLGRDKLGNLYWYQVDSDATLRVYKDDPEEETWQLVAKDKDELVVLLNSLKSGPTFVTETENGDALTTNGKAAYLFFVLINIKHMNDNIYKNTSEVCLIWFQNCPSPTE